MAALIWGGSPVPTMPVKFRCPADKLKGHSFMDARGLGVMVCPERYLTRESREFSPATPLRFVFRKPRTSFWTGRVSALRSPCAMRWSRCQSWGAVWSEP